MAPGVGWLRRVAQAGGSGARADERAETGRALDGAVGTAEVEPVREEPVTALGEHGDIDLAQSRHIYEAAW